MWTIDLIFIQKEFEFLFELVNTIFLSFPISNQKAQCLQVRVQAIPQLKKNMKSGPYMIRMVKRFTQDGKKQQNVWQLEQPFFNVFFVAVALFYNH